MEQVQMKSASPMAPTVVKPKLGNPSQGTVQAGQPVQQNNNQVAQPDKKRSLWWMWLLIGIIVGALGFWGYSSFLS